MSSWMEEVEHLEKQCELTTDCEACPLGYCIDSRKRGVTNFDESKDGRTETETDRTEDKRNQQ